jgi:hypothetical protein
MRARRKPRVRRVLQRRPSRIAVQPVACSMAPPVSSAKIENPLELIVSQRRTFGLFRTLHMPYERDAYLKVVISA